MFGVSMGAMVNLSPVTTFQLSGPENYSIAIGIVFTLMGFASAGTGPFFGKHFRNCIYR